MKIQRIESEAVANAKRREAVELKNFAVRRAPMVEMEPSVIVVFLK